MDNHGATGGNWGFTDGSGRFITGNIQRAVFSGRFGINATSAGTNGAANSNVVQTID